MFKNTGNKLQVIGKTLFVLLFIGSIAAAVAFFFTGDKPQVLTGILVIIGGFFVAWLTGLCMIALGKAAQSADSRPDADSAVLKRMTNLEHKIDWFIEEQNAARQTREAKEEREAREKKEKTKKK